MPSSAVDPDSIGLWIRIRNGIRIKEDKNDLHKKKLINFIFWSARCSIWKNIRKIFLNFWSSGSGTGSGITCYESGSLSGSGFNAITLMPSITKAPAEFLLSQIDFSFKFCHTRIRTGIRSTIGVTKKKQDLNVFEHIRYALNSRLTQQLETIRIPKHLNYGTNPQ